MPTSNKSITYTDYSSLADLIVLKAESRTTFLNLLEAHIQKLQPANPVENAIVEKMAADFWRLSRRYTIDLARFDASPGTSTAEESAAVEANLLVTYESRLRLKYKHSLRLLQMFRSRHRNTRPSADPQGRRPSERILLLKPVSTKCQRNLKSVAKSEVPTGAKQT